METKRTQWSKDELKVYILLVCANADKVEGEEEINLIKSKVDDADFERMYGEFSEDTQEQSLEKIRENVSKHNYSHRELTELQREMREIFIADERYRPLERNLENILHNIIY